MTAGWILLCVGYWSCPGAGHPAAIANDLTREQCRVVLSAHYRDQGECVSPEGKVYLSEDDFLAEDYPTRKAGAKK